MTFNDQYTSLFISQLFLYMLKYVENSKKLIVNAKQCS